MRKGCTGEWEKGRTAKGAVVVRILLTVRWPCPSFHSGCSREALVDVDSVDSVDMR